MPANLGNSAVAMRLEEKSVFIPIPKKGNAKECSLLHNITHLTLYQSNDQNSPSKASTLRELRNPDVQARFRKGRGTRD